MESAVTGTVNFNMLTLRQCNPVAFGLFISLSCLITKSVKTGVILNLIEMSGILILTKSVMVLRVL